MTSSVRGQMIVYRWGWPAARSLSRLTRSGAATVWVATTSVWLFSQLIESSATRTGIWVKATSGSNLLRAHSTRSLRVMP